MANIVKGRRWQTGTPFVGFAPGDFIFGSCYAESESDNPKWIRFGCPRGNGECTVPISPQKTARGATWRWDGNRDAPTLTPSINCLAQLENGQPAAGCGWHGFLKNGQFEEAG